MKARRRLRGGLRRRAEACGGLQRPNEKSKKKEKKRRKKKKEKKIESRKLCSYLHWSAVRLAGCGAACSRRNVRFMAHRRQSGEAGHGKPPREPIAAKATYIPFNSHIPYGQDRFCTTGYTTCFTSGYNAARCDDK